MGNPKVDWVLKDYDPATTEPPNVETELMRLQTLKSYHILDTSASQTYGRFVSLARKLFRVQAACINLIDLGRYWMLAGEGLPDELKEGPRQTALCAHVIQSTLPVFQVQDLQHDKRFQKHPFVTKRGYGFYAAAPLISREGYKIGTIFIVDDSTSRTMLTPDEQQALVDLSSSIMDLMEEKRVSLQAGVHHSGITYSLDVQRSIAFLKERIQKLVNDKDLQTVMTDQQNYILKCAADSADFLQKSLVPSSKKRKATDEAAVAEPSSRKARAPNIGENTDVELAKFVRSLEFVMDSFPKKVVLTIVTDPSLPERLFLNDLKVFRSAIAMLTSACERTQDGFVRLSILRRKNPHDDAEQLVFECEDTGPDVELELFESLFHPPEDLGDSMGARECISYDEKSGELTKNGSKCTLENQPVGNGFAVHGVASYIGSIGGQYGFKPRTVSFAASGHITGSIFWFSIPLRSAQLFDMAAVAQSPSDQQNLAPTTIADGFHKFENAVFPAPKNDRPSWLDT